MSCTTVQLTIRFYSILHVNASTRIIIIAACLLRHIHPHLVRAKSKHKSKTATFFLRMFWINFIWCAFDSLGLFFSCFGFHHRQFAVSSYFRIFHWCAWWTFCKKRKLRHVFICVEKSKRKKASSTHAAVFGKEKKLPQKWNNHKYRRC